MKRSVPVTFYKGGMEWPSNGKEEMENIDATYGMGEEGIAFTVVSCEESSVFKGEPGSKYQECFVRR